MKTKTITGVIATQEFLTELLESDCTADFRTIDEDKELYEIRWIKNKKYKTYDNKVETDEVWSTENGTLIAIQDLSGEHARNVLRMLIKNSCLQQEKLYEALQHMSESVLNTEGIMGTDDEDETRVLH